MSGGTNNGRVFTSRNLSVKCGAYHYELNSLGGSLTVELLTDVPNRLFFFQVIVPENLTVSGVAPNGRDLTRIEISDNRRLAGSTLFDSDGRAHVIQPDFSVSEP